MDIRSEFFVLDGEFGDSASLVIREGVDSEVVGRVRIERLQDNVIITVEREDEARFGPVSLVVV